MKVGQTAVGVGMGLVIMPGLWVTYHLAIQHTTSMLSLVLLAIGLALVGFGLRRLA